MIAEDLVNILGKKPFEPFRIHMGDGATYEISHPELVMTGLSVAIIGFPAKASLPQIFGRTETIALNHIVRFQPLSQTSTSNGQS